MRRIFLRGVPDEAGQLRLGVRYAAADAAARIGGDLSDVVTTAGALRLIVGDVQGKGLDAVHAAAVVLGAFREWAYDAGSLTEIAAHLELSLARQTGGGSSSPRSWLRYPRSATRRPSSIAATRHHCCSTAPGRGSLSHRRQIRRSGWPS